MNEHLFQAAWPITQTQTHRQAGQTEFTIEILRHCREPPPQKKIGDTFCRTLAVGLCV